MADVYETIANAANKYGVPVEALLAIAKIESGFNPNAQNPRSSAGGLFQFTDATAKEYGLTGDKRNDVAAQADAAARMIQTNSRSLTKTLGRAPNAGELYLAHQQGLTGARALLANPNLTAAQALEGIYGGRAASVIRQNGGDPNAPASQFASQWVNKGNETASLFPPGELPQVATALSTVPTPRAPMPVTPSIDMAMMRKGAAPSQLIRDTFASLPKSNRNLGDEIGMSPIPGGKQQAPLFDAGFDTRTNAMRLFSNGPADTQGVFTGASKAPAPVPRMPSPQLAAKRATDPNLQAALNARYPAQLPPLPSPVGQSPSTRPVATTTIRPSASDKVRGNPMQTMEQATTIASIPTRPQVSASDMARGKSGISTIASYPTTGFPTTAQITGATGFRPPPAVPDRLMASAPGLPELYGPGVAGVGTRAVAPVPFPRPATQFAAAPKVAPVPFPRPTGVGTSLDVRPMPPMPIPRPPMGMGGGERPAPVPAIQSQALMMRRLQQMPQMPRPAQQQRPIYDRTTGTFIAPPQGQSMSWNDGVGTEPMSQADLMKYGRSGRPA